MSNMKIVGFVLLIVGVVLLFFGWQSSEGLDDQVSEAVTGEYTDSTMWYIILGVIAAAAGAFLAFFKK
jgi:LPXTG-motif cell wall-anchored protein